MISKGDNDIKAHPEERPSWKIPPFIVIAVIVFGIIQSAVILNVRGVVDAEGYPWNGAKPIPINTYEDDGRINVYGALGFLQGSSHRHSSLINIGGPYIHCLRLLTWMGSKIGIIESFDHPYNYFTYRSEYLRIWKFLGLCKVWLFLIWMPIVLYWIGSRHFSRGTGIIAAVLVVCIPVRSGFEPRLKADSVAIILGLFSILWQLEYLRDRKRRALFLAAVLP